MTGQVLWQEKTKLHLIVCKGSHVFTFVQTRFASGERFTIGYHCKATTHWPQPVQCRRALQRLSQRCCSVLLVTGFKHQELPRFVHVVQMVFSTWCMPLIPIVFSWCYTCSPSLWSLDSTLKIYQQLQECQQLCMGTIGCNGIEYSRDGRCELWTRASGLHMLQREIQLLVDRPAPWLQ